jgi:hypothetical protein
VLVVVIGLLLFGCAGTARYWQAWTYLSIFTAASALISLDLMRRDRVLLERRMRGGPTAEKRPAQKLIMPGTSVAFLAFWSCRRSITGSGGLSCRSPLSWPETLSWPSASI